MRKCLLIWVKRKECRRTKTCSRPCVIEVVENYLRPIVVSDIYLPSVTSELGQKPTVSGMYSRTSPISCQSSCIAWLLAWGCDSAAPEACSQPVLEVVTRGRSSTGSAIMQMISEDCHPERQGQTGDKLRLVTEQDTQRCPICQPVFFFFW